MDFQDILEFRQAVNLNDKNSSVIYGNYGNENIRKSSGLLVPPDLDGSIPYSHKPRHGADDRDDGHCIHGQGRRNGTRCISHCRRILHGRIHDRVRIQHRVTDHHCPAQWRGPFPGNRQCILPRSVLPAGTGSGDGSSLGDVFAMADRKNGVISGDSGRRAELCQMEDTGTVS